MLKSFRDIAVACGFVAATLSASAVMADPVLLKWGHVQEASHPLHQWALRAADEFAAQTDNRYKIEIYPAGILGNDTVMNEGLTLGTVDLVYSGFGWASQYYAPIAVGNAPYLFRDIDHLNTFSASDVLDEFSGKYEEATGHSIVAVVYTGARHITSNREITRPADMAGFKLRVPNAQIYQVFPNAIGANPTPMALDEVYLALSNGTIDGQENPLATIQSKNFQEVQKYITLTGHVLDTSTIVVGGGAWSKIEEADRAILRNLLAEAAVKAGEELRAREIELVEWFRQNGTTVNEIDTGPFKEVVEPAVMSNTALWTPELIERIKGL